MQVVKASFESYFHNVCADLVGEEMAGVKLHSIGAVLRAPVYAVAVRVTAVTAHVFWIANEVILFLPRMIGLTVGLAVSERAGLTAAFFHRAAQVYGLYFKTTCAQFTLATAACVAPEISHYALALHKSLFSLQLETFVQTMPDLPHVHKKIRKNDVLIESFAVLALRLGITQDEWRRELINSIKATCHGNPRLAPDYLTTDSHLFQEAFKRALIKVSCNKLNERQSNNTFTSNIVASLHPALWIQMKDSLHDDTQLQLIRLLTETIIDRENNEYFLYLYKSITKFNFREPRSVQACRILLENMKLAAKELVDRNIYTKDDIECCMAESLSAVTMTGILRFIESAKLIEGEPKAISFKTAAGREITFQHEYQFFGAKQMLVDFKIAILKLKDTERDALFLRASGNDKIVLNEKVTTAFHLLQALKMEVIDKKMSENKVDAQSSIPWGEAFYG